MTCIADISCAYNGHMETNTDHINITTVRIGNGSKVHYAIDGSSRTFCNLWRNIRKAYGAEANCERCAESVRLRDYTEMKGGK